ncbi:hypothetical protein IFR05_006640 [Cadophora sp. M221]|nr:hypothetical protein IFR05_006640 [Cadophora sp. M221]
MHCSFLTLSLLGSVSAALGADVWTVNCGVLTIQRSDPIVSPGGPSSHVHAISGGTAFSRNMPGINDAVNAKATTCDKYTDHSNYWCPQLYNRRDGMFELVPFTGANMYYKKFTCDYQAGGQWCPRPSGARPFPPGLRMVAGNPFRRTQNDSEQSNQAILYETGGVGEMYGFPKVIQGRLQMNVRFPSCWDGKNLDSPDHKSHMSYPDPTKGDTQGGMCPSTHPIALLHIGAEFGFDTNALNITDSSTLVFSMGDTTGYGGHADFIQGWEDLAALGESFDNCNGFGDACAWNSFGTPDGKEGVKRDLDPEIPAVFEEEIGLNGPIAKLPGDNPVWDGVVSALPKPTLSVLPSVVLPGPSTLVTLTTSRPVAATLSISPVQTTPIPTLTSTSSSSSTSLAPLPTQEPSSSTSTSSSQSPSSTSTSTPTRKEQYEKWMKWLQSLSDDVLDEISEYI